MRWTATLPDLNRLPGVTLSPDGLHLVYRSTSSGQILVRQMDQLEAKPIAGTQDASAVGQTVSPDGRWILYYVAGSHLLKKVPLTGGASTTICETQSVRGASWGPDDTIVFGGGNGGLSQVPAAGGTPQVIATPDPNKGEFLYAQPHFLPSGKAVVFTISTGAAFGDARIAVVNLRTNEKRVLLDAGASPRYAPTGHLIYARAGSLFAVLFDPDRLQVKGSPVPVLGGIYWIRRTGNASYSFSSSGTLVYLPEAAEEEHRTMVWVDRNGKAEALPAAPRAYATPSLSPDGQRIAVSVGGGGNEYNIWIYEVARDALTRLTVGSRLNFAPVWSPDGKRVTFRSLHQKGFAIYSVPADRSGAPEELYTNSHAVTPGSWSRNGGLLASHRGSGEKPRFGCWREWAMPAQRSARHGR
jgi:hypothetical protein